MKSLALYTHGCLWASLRNCASSFYASEDAVKAMVLIGNEFANFKKQSTAIIIQTTVDKYLCQKCVLYACT